MMTATPTAEDHAIAALLAGLDPRRASRQPECSISAFARLAWPVLEPATPYLHNWHLDAICDYLTAVSAGEITRLVINMPPRYGKSNFVSVFWPCWEWTFAPESRWLFASYSGSLSTKHSVDRRTLIESPWYQSRWGDRVSLRGDQNLKTEFQNTRRGHMIATSVGGTATGKGGMRIVIDDPHNPKQALSDVQREEALRFYNLTVSTRLDDKRTGTIVLVMQRLHEKDLTAHVEELGFTKLALPAETDLPTTIVMPGGQTIERPAGILWPEREGAPELLTQRRALGSYGYAAQYQQRPAPAGGGLFKRAWFRILDVLPAADPIYGTTRFWDAAGTEGGGDYAVGAKLIRYASGLYVIADVVRGQWSPGDLDRIIQQTAAIDGYRVRIREEQEPGSSGKAVIAARTRALAGYDYKGIPSTGEKSTRWRPFAVQAEAGNVALVRAEWNDALLHELTLVPAADHDDQADALSGAFLDLALAPLAAGRLKLTGF